VNSTVRVRWGRSATFLALGLVLILGFTAAVAIAMSSGSSQTSWPTNASGLTYGSSGDALSPEDEPDLVKVGATNGKTGYAYRTDLEEPTPKSPQEALRIQAARAGSSKSIPVYFIDGQTKIGAFVINY
jgi:hypothetical protein